MPRKQRVILRPGKSKRKPKQIPWEELLTNGHRSLRVVRGVFAHLPSDPRCRLCVAPFGGLGGRVSKFMGFGPSRMNPNFCSNCLERLPPGGAEVSLAVLFADVRSSTEMGGSVAPAEFARRMNEFYEIATHTVLKHDGLLDKLIGDEVMALFIPGLCGPDYVKHACDAAVELVRTVGSEVNGLPVGAGVNSGRAFVGNVGGTGIFDFTALGDTINVGARLQGVAEPGEVVISREAFPFAGNVQGAQPRTATLKGKDEPVQVWVAKVG
jgi:adenylate cyclase